MAKSIVKFASSIYGNYLDNYYTNDYTSLITLLENQSLITWEGNLGFIDGVVISNVFKGDFTKVNCAVVQHELYGKHLYKITNKKFIRRGIWSITMVKDMVSSNYNNLLNSKILVERIGIDRTKFNPILLLKEPLQLSSVKKQHILLREINNKTSYGYLLFWKRNSLDGTITWQPTSYNYEDYDIIVNKLEDFKYYNKQIYRELDIEGSTNIYDGSPFSGTRSFINLHFRMLDTRVLSAVDLVKNTVSSSVLDSKAYTTTNRDDFAIVEDKAITQNSYYEDYAKNKILELLKDYLIDSEEEPASNYVNKTILEKSTGKVYKINISEHQGSASRPINVMSKELLFNIFGVPFNNPITSSTEFHIMEGEWYEYTYEVLRTIENPTYKFSVYPENEEQPFQIQFIPILTNINVSYKGNKYSTEHNHIVRLLYDLISKYGGDNSKLIDIQMIPFAPIQNLKGYYDSATNTFDLSASSVRDVFISDSTIIPIFNVSKCDYMGTISYDENVIDYKVDSYKTYRLTSPSGANTYDFDITLNGGLNGFIYRCSLRPYASYFCLQPKFKNIYGRNYNDTRGLIWKEDSSITQISNAWETYKRQNINYLNSFNANMNYKQSSFNINKEATWGNYGFDASQRLIAAGVDAAKTAAEAVANDFFGIKGAMSGGTAAGVIMGGAALSEGLEAGQTAYNIHKEEQLFKVGIENERNQFNYQLSNIKALPENLDKVSGIYTTNNKVPYLQVFEPTEEEKTYLNDYLDLKGVNVGMVLDIKNMEFNYIQGAIIKMNTSITNEEYKELHKQLAQGVRKYIWKEE